MNLSLLAFGKLKSPGFAESARHYEKHLGGWVTLRVHELKPVAVPDKSAAARKLIQDREGVILLEKLGKLHPSALVYPLDERGDALSTAKWSELARRWEHEGCSQICFCIGGSLGFSDSVRKRATRLLSLGPQTLSHELARVVLLEQLYRAFSILRGHPYHNA